MSARTVSVDAVVRALREKKFLALMSDLEGTANGLNEAIAIVRAIAARRAKRKAAHK